MTDESDEIRRCVDSAAGRLQEATTAIDGLRRRKEFLRELHEKGNWLANGPADPPPWIRRWSEYWENLKTNPDYVRATSEAAAAREALHGAEFESALERLRHRDASGVEYGIAYLEADPWYFRSGYLKGRIARWLRQVELTPHQQERLHKVLLSSLERGSRYEQVEYRKLARRIDTAQFRGQLGALAKSKDTALARRAAMMLKVCQLNDTKGRDFRGAR